MNTFATPSCLSQMRRCCGTTPLVHRLLLSLAGLLLAVLPLGAQVAFLDFSTGVTGWTTTGSVTAQSTTRSFTIGGSPYSLTPASGESMVIITPAGSSVDGASAADTALGLTAGTINTLLNTGGFVTNFGVLTKSFTLTAGTYSFAWAYAASDYQPYNDGVLFSVAGGGSQQVLSLARNGSNPADLSGPDADTLILGSYGSTAWNTDTFTLASDGTYQVSFASYNWNDDGLDPVFFVAATPGTFTGTAVQTSGGGGATPNIDTAVASYSAAGVGSTVNPAFEGGTLLADATTVGSAFTVSDAGGTIQAQGGVTATFSGVISNASGASTGGVAITNSGSGGSVTFTGANTYTGSTTVATGATLTLSGGGSLASSSVTVASGATLNNQNGGLSSSVNLTANGTVNLGAAETIGQLNGGGGVNLGSYTLTLGSGNFSGVIGGTGGLTKTGTDALTLSGTNTFTGTTALNGGTTTLSGSLASTQVTVAQGATLNNQNGGLAATAALTNAGTVALGANDTVATLVNSGTLSGTGHQLTAATYTLNQGSVINANLGAGALTANGAVTLNGTSAAGTVDVASGTLTLGAAERLADSANVTLTGNLVLGGNETIQALAGTGAANLGAFTLTVGEGNYAGVASGTGGLTKFGPGSLVLAGANTYTGATNVDAGTLTLGGTLASTTVTVAGGATLNNQNGGLATAAALTNAGTVALGANDTVATLVNSGTLNGTGHQLTAATYTLNQGSVINANLGAGGLIANGTVSLNGTSAAGTVDVASGTLTLGAAERLADAASVTLTGNLVLGGSETIQALAGTGAANLGAFTLAVGEGNYAGVASGTGGLTKFGPGSLVLAGDNTFTGTTTLNGGTTTLSGSLASTQVTIANGATLDNANGGLADDAEVQVDGSLALGADEEIGQLTGSGQVALADNTLSIQAGNFSGELTGTGTFEKLGAGILILAGDSSHTGTVDVRGGTVELAAGGTLASADISVRAAGTFVTHGGLADAAYVRANGVLQLAGDETISDLRGSGAVEAASHTFALSSGQFAGDISGSGHLVKQGADSLTLSGENTHTGTAQFNAGTVVLTGSLDSATVNIAAGATLDSQSGGLAAEAALTNAGTVTLGADETVATLVNNGALNGTGHRLTAATYALNDGSVVNANLGEGALTANGAVALNGTSAAGSVDVASGTLTLGAAERLADTASVTLTGSLMLGGNETIHALNGAGAADLGAFTFAVGEGNYGGVASGTGGLTKTGPGTLILSAANTYNGTTNLQGGTTVLTGSLESGAVQIAAGATLDNINAGLAANSYLANAGTVNLGADEQIAALVNSGTLNGTGRTLTAATYALNDGANINANLGTGALTSSGATRLNGTSAAATVDVAGGTLTLGAADRLADSAIVTVASGAALHLNGDELVGRLVSAGQVGGAAGSTLTAPVYDLRDGAVIDANLGHGLLLSNGLVRLNGESAAEEVAVQSGSLTLGGPDRLADYSWVDISLGARLVLANGNDVIRLLTGAGDVELNNGAVLIVHSGSYSGTAYSTGALLKDEAPKLILSGMSTYESGTVVRSGELEVTRSGQLTSDVVVENRGLFRANGTVHGSVFVEAGGRLQGSGRIEQNVINEGVTAPGNSPGVLVVNGDYTESGRLSIEIDGGAGIGAAAGHDLLQVNGRVIVNPGSTLELTRSLNNGFEPAAGDRFLVVQAADGIEGRFSYLDRSAFTTQLFFDHGTGYVYGSGVAAGGDVAVMGGDTPNQRAVMSSLQGGAVTADDNGQAAFFDSRSGQGALFNALLNAPSWSEALQAMSPEAYAGVTDYALQVSRNYGRDAAQAPALVMAGGWRISGGHTGYRIHTANAAGETNYALRSHGGSIGVSRQVGRGFTVGVFHQVDSGAVTADRLHLEVKGSYTGVQAAYVPRRDGRWSFDAGLARADYDYDGGRATFLGRTSATTEARAQDYWANARFEALRHRNLSLAAVSGFAYTKARVDGFVESGAADAQEIGALDDRLVTGELGLELGLRLSARTHFVAQATYVANFQDARREVWASLPGGSGRYRVTAPGLDEDAMRFGGSLVYRINERVSASGYYASHVTSGNEIARNYGVSLRMAF